MAIPDYVAERIRCAVPVNCSVVPNSTPVVSFGNAGVARVATLGLNPSRVEFEEKGVRLDGTKRRLATHQSLEVTTLVDAPDAVVAKVLTDCHDYFLRNPYWKWFGQLETLLTSAVGASYKNGTACHLDLVQWATDPTWGHLAAAARKQLIAADRAFLRQQLMSERIELVLLNGGRVIDEVASTGVAFVSRPGAVDAVHGKSTPMVVGRDRGIFYVGWRVNLQSSPGVTNRLRSAIADRVRDEVGSAGLVVDGDRSPAPGSDRR